MFACRLTRSALVSFFCRIKDIDPSRFFKWHSRLKQVLIVKDLALIVVLTNRNISLLFYIVCSLYLEPVALHDINKQDSNYFVILFKKTGVPSLWI